MANSVLLPAHASTADDTGSIPGELPVSYLGSVTVEDILYQISIQCFAGSCTVKILESADEFEGSVFFYQGASAPGVGACYTDATE